MTTNDPDAVIRLSRDNYDVDWPTLFVDRLNQQWDSRNSDNSKPDIVLQETEGQADVSRDTIRIYMTTDPSRLMTLGKKYKNQTIMLTFVFFAKGSRAHMLRMLGEAERIVQANAIDTVNSNLNQTNLKGRVWTEWGVRGVREDRYTKLFYKATVDVQVNWRMRRVVT